MSADLAVLQHASLHALTTQRSAFEASFGRQAAAFLEHLPALYRLFHRLSFDLDAPHAARQQAALVAGYIAEAQDYLGEGSQGVTGLIDDLWVAYTVLAQLAERGEDSWLQRHWCGAVPLDDALALAANVDVLRPLVPSRVMEQLVSYLG